MPFVAEGQPESVTMNGLDADDKVIELVFNRRALAVTGNVPLEQLTVEVSRKPLNNLVWLGTVFFTVGFTLALLRRWVSGTAV